LRFLQVCTIRRDTFFKYFDKDVPEYSDLGHLISLPTVHSEDEMDENNRPVRKGLFWRHNLLGTLFSELDKLHIDTQEDERSHTRAVKALIRGPHVEISAEAKRTCKPPVGFPKSLVSEEFRQCFSKAARAALKLSNNDFNLPSMIEHCQDMQQN
jgi:hypothetical protein